MSLIGDRIIIENSAQDRVRFNSTQIISYSKSYAVFPRIDRSNLGSKIIKQHGTIVPPYKMSLEVKIDSATFDLLFDIVRLNIENLKGSQRSDSLLKLYDMRIPLSNTALFVDSSIERPITSTAGDSQWENLSGGWKNVIHRVIVKDMKWKRNYRNFDATLSMVEYIKLA